MEFIPDAKNCDCLLTKEKGLGVLHFELMVLPLTVNTIILEHVCLQQTNNYNTHTTNNQQTHFTHFLKFTIGLRIWQRKKERKGKSYGCNNSNVIIFFTFFPSPNPLFKHSLRRSNINQNQIRTQKSTNQNHILTREGVLKLPDPHNIYIT